MALLKALHHQVCNFFILPALAAPVENLFSTKRKASGS